MIEFFSSLDIDQVNAIFNGAMALGAILILQQISLAEKQARTKFEDTINKEYREIIHQIPARALLGEPLTENELHEHLDEFLYYVDLSNEQIFLRSLNRVRKTTWREWNDGMRSNFQRPAFKQAWDLIKSKSSSDFNELRRLEESDFREDPKKWK
ncbi:MAG: hypothetical protein AAB601_03235 [Patescibacteria group bacterium]